MKKNNDTRTSWHIYIIIVTVLVISMISWTSFVKNMKSSIKSNHTQNHQSMTAGAKNAESANSNNLISRYNLLETVIDEVNDQWSIYNQDNFSHMDLLTTYFITGEISSLQVIGGKDHWLFYGSKTDGDPIADYEGTQRYTQAEINEAYNAAFSVQQKMQERGIQFAILVPPNKENIYAELMPDTYSHSEQSRTDDLIDSLSAGGINIVSPKTNFLNYHNDFQIYYAYDTHWNQLGAYLATQNTLQTWGINMPDLSERTITSSELRKGYHYFGEDDLAQMLGMRSIFSDETEYIVDGTQSMDWTSFETEQSNSEVSSFHNETATTKASILLIGDSFRSSMLPSLREAFSDVYVVHRSYFTSNMINEINPDYIIAEYVERYSSEIKNIDKLFE